MNDRKVEFIICPKCGWKYTTEAIGCRFCGTKFGVVVEETAPVIVEPKPIKRKVKK